MEIKHKSLSGIIWVVYLLGLLYEWGFARAEGYPSSRDGQRARRVSPFRALFLPLSFLAHRVWVSLSCLLLD